MKKWLKPILTELLWLIAILTVTMLLCLLLFDWYIWPERLDIQLHDSSLIIHSALIITPLFLLITFLIYYIKEVRRNFKKVIPSIILLLTGIILIVMVTVVNMEFIKLGTVFGFTLYPPLSGLANISPGSAELSPLAERITTALTILQLGIILALFYMTFQWGKNSRITSKFHNLV